MSKLDKYQKEAREAKEEVAPEKPVEVLSSNSQEMRELPREVPSPSDDPGKFLVGLLKVAPFSNLFDFVASCLFLGKTANAKAIKFKAAHPWFFRVCFSLDIFTRFSVVVLLLAAAAGALYRLFFR
jgi:hypothetical protein